MTCTCRIVEARIDGIPALHVIPDPHCTHPLHDEK